MKVKLTHVKSGAFVCALSLSGLLGFSNAQATSREPACDLLQSSGFCQEPMLTSSEFEQTNFVTLPKLQTVPRLVSDFGTFKNPFAVDSFWNSRPTKVVFDNFEIPTSSYFPKVGTGSYSTAAFLAQSTDPAETVYGLPNSRGVWNPDSESYTASVRIPRWPANLIPATGTDGHADIIDEQAGVIHSFWQLKKDTTGRWVAALYSWSKLKGRGWGDGAHYYQGARAAAVPSSAGIIRKHELNDGQSQYYHALSMSLTYNGLSGKQPYVYPATSGDTTWTANTGGVPEGALMMLPPTFDANSIQNLALRKVVRTLQTYGAYVVDRNVGTPFYIYVENGTNFDLHQGGWNNTVAADLQRVRAALRQVVKATGWVNGINNPIVSKLPIELVSMRGPWKNTSGGAAVPLFNSNTQLLTFVNTTKIENAENSTGRALAGVNWAKPVAGRLYEFRVKSSNGGKAWIRFWGNGASQFHSGALGNGETYRFYWPNVLGMVITGAKSGIGAQTSISFSLVEVKQ